MVLVGHTAPLWDLCLVMSECAAPGCGDQCEAVAVKQWDLERIFFSQQQYGAVGLKAIKENL